jgi:hypothetical protein
VFIAFACHSIKAVIFRTELRGERTWQDQAPRLRMRGVTPPFPNMSSWHGAWLSIGTTSPAALPPGKSPGYSLDRMLGVPQSRSGRGGEGKNSQPSSGIES